MVFAVVVGVVVAVVDEEEDGDGEFAAEGRRFVSGGSCRKQLLERLGESMGVPQQPPSSPRSMHPHNPHTLQYKSALR